MILMLSDYRGDRRPGLKRVCRTKGVKGSLLCHAGVRAVVLAQEMRAQAEGSWNVPARAAGKISPALGHPTLSSG